ncbi:hypothetical protein [Chitinophaga alhagiae]|uniref:hypothetical protein n=1 Tax=Chitinophaga alhagiae TaxID=2203219 RepID=UPI00130046E0|nr:hypothetical protein [Chitinophaga alhagiae]
MKTESYVVQLFHKGKKWNLPVKVEELGAGFKISARVEEKEICFARDDHNGLRAINHQEDFDPQFLYLLASEIQRMYQLSR